MCAINVMEAIPLCDTIEVYIYIFMSIQNNNPQYKLVSTWLHASAAHAAIFRPANKTSTLMCAQYGIP
jgi:hypothetical protein